MRCRPPQARRLRWSLDCVALALVALATAVGCRAARARSGAGLAAGDPGGPRATGDGAAPGDARGGDAGFVAGPLSANRDRLLDTYLAYLQAHPDQTQSNGLSGSGLANVCQLWQRLDPSSQAVFLTLTARMQGSILGADGSAMLSHVVRLYRIAGGQGATAADSGSCGGGEYNRMIMATDRALHAALAAANADQGARTSGGSFDIADIPAGGFWRNSHDSAGPHAPFDASDETNDGAPRGQVQYFADPGSSVANAPLGRMDLIDLVDPYALEMDQDYDCFHNSNPRCSYTLYGVDCLPQPAILGLAIYGEHYGPVDTAWRPSGC